MTGGKPIADPHSISGVSAVYPLVAFTTFMEEREDDFFSVPDTTLNNSLYLNYFYMNHSIISL
jgi:hypothetical protein